MSLLEALATFVGELAAYLLGLVVGRTFHLSPEKAQAVGEYLILGIVAGAAIALTVIYA